MSQTENTETNSEQIRKVFVKDLKVGEAVHTVFRATGKERHQTRAGKSYLGLWLVDRTGQVDARVFENVPAADNAFSDEDYLLVRGKVGSFHGKTQIVIDQLERLDPGPIDAAEFAWTPPPAPPQREDKRPEKEARALRLSKRLERLLENPQLAQALDTFVAHLEKALDAQRAAGIAPAPKSERPERRPRGPKVEHRHAAGKPEAAEAPKAPELKRDPTLPEGLAFKPLAALVGEGDKGTT